MSEKAFTIPIIGTMYTIAINISKNGKPINTKDRIPAITINMPITIWNNKACTEMLFTSSSELMRKNKIGTKNGAKNALACMITLDHFVSIYMNLPLQCVFISYTPIYGTIR